jgi:hypothetical protein
MLASSETTVFSRLKAVFGMGFLLSEISHYLTSNRACHIAIPLYICGFVTLGAAFQKHLGVGALIMGWGIAQLAIMIATVAVYAYCNDAFPKHQVCETFFKVVLNFPIPNFKSIFFSL